MTMNSYFEPDYEGACTACGQSPTVLAVENGNVVAATGLCGPCTWGTADAIDPSTWNGEMND